MTAQPSVDHIKAARSIGRLQMDTAWSAMRTLRTAMQTVQRSLEESVAEAERKHVKVNDDGTCAIEPGYEGVDAEGNPTLDGSKRATAVGEIESEIRGRFAFASAADGHDRLRGVGAEERPLEGVQEEQDQLQGLRPARALRRVRFSGRDRGGLQAPCMTTCGRPRSGSGVRCAEDVTACDGELLRSLAVCADAADVVSTRFEREVGWPDVDGYEQLGLELELATHTTHTMLPADDA